MTSTCTKMKGVALVCLLVEVAHGFVVPTQRARAAGRAVPPRVAAAGRAVPPRVAAAASPGDSDGDPFDLLLESAAAAIDGSTGQGVMGRANHDASRYEWGTWVDKGLMATLQDALDAIEFSPPTRDAREPALGAVRAAFADAGGEGARGAARVDLGRGADWRVTLHAFESAGARSSRRRSRAPSLAKPLLGLVEAAVLRREPLADDGWRRTSPRTLRGGAEAASAGAAADAASRWVGGATREFGVAGRRGGWRPSLLLELVPRRRGHRSRAPTAPAARPCSSAARGPRSPRHFALRRRRRRLRPRPSPRPRPSRPSRPPHRASPEPEAAADAGGGAGPKTHAAGWAKMRDGESRRSYADEMTSRRQRLAADHDAPRRAAAEAAAPARAARLSCTPATAASPNRLLSRRTTPPQRPPWRRPPRPSPRRRPMRPRRARSARRSDRVRARRRARRPA